MGTSSLPRIYPSLPGVGVGVWVQLCALFRKNLGDFLPKYTGFFATRSLGAAAGVVGWSVITGGCR
jgi:hypothetical protein